MTVFQRAAAIAAFSFGIIGLAAMSTPVDATQAASETIVASAPLPQPFQLPVTTTAVPNGSAITEIPSQQTVAQTDALDRTALDAAKLDAANDDDDSAAFQSLAAAVASQVAPGDVSTELKCLAGAIYYEAKGEPLAGQLAVAEVIINRARSGRFPRSLCGVVTQAGQFSFVRGGAMPAINPTLAQWKTALSVAQVALGDAWESPASEAMYFHARRVSPGWAKSRIASIGNHVFYR